MRILMRCLVIQSKVDAAMIAGRRQREYAPWVAVRPMIG